MKTSHLRCLALALCLLAAPLATYAADPKPAGMRTIYLIRHGIYDRDERADDRVGNGLNALGREQAKFAGGRLAALPVKMTRLVSSTLTRARETADIMGAALALAAGRDSLISECTPKSMVRPSVMQGQPAEEILACDLQLEAAWKKYAVVAGESDQHDVLVCHGNVIRWFVAKAIGAATDDWAMMDIANGSLTAIVVRPDSTTRLVIFSDVGHLPLDKQTWSGKGPGWTAAQGAKR